MDGGVYLYFGDSLLTKGSHDDLARLGIEPKEGLSLNFYDLDADENGNPNYLCAKGVLYKRSDGKWQADIDQSSFHWIPRADAE